MTTVFSIAYAVIHTANGINGTNGTNGTDGNDGITPSFTIGTVTNLSSGNNPKLLP